MIDSFDCNNFSSVQYFYLYFSWHCSKDQIVEQNMFVLLLGCWTLSLISINVYFIVSSYCSPACGWCGIYMVLLNNRGTILLLSVFQYNHYKHTLPSDTSFNHLHILHINCQHISYFGITLSLLTLCQKFYIIENLG